MASAQASAVGALLGATALSSLSTEDAAPVMATILLAVGLYVLLRFSLRTPPVVKPGHTRHGLKFLAPLGLFGGVIVLTNSQKLVKYFRIGSPWSTLVYADRGGLGGI